MYYGRARFVGDINEGPAQFTITMMPPPKRKKGLPKSRKAFSKSVKSLKISEILYYYFTASTTALKASGLFIAKSANTLRFKPISLAFNLPIKTE